MNAPAIALLVAAAAAAPAMAGAQADVHVLRASIGSLEPVTVHGTAEPGERLVLAVTDSGGARVAEAGAEAGPGGAFHAVIPPPAPSFGAGLHRVTVIYPGGAEGPSASFVVRPQELPEGPAPGPAAPAPRHGGIPVEAAAEEGSDVITVRGTAPTWGTDVVLRVTSPAGNLVSISQVAPRDGGAFEADIRTGGPLWREDGPYTITASQRAGGAADGSVTVDIAGGVVVPEFGAAAAVLAASAAAALAARHARYRY